MFSFVFPKEQNEYFASKLIVDTMNVLYDKIAIFQLLLLFTPLEFFTSVLADGFSLEFEWQHVSSSLQNSSQYSGRPQQCCRLDSLYPSANFQVLQAL